MPPESDAFKDSKAKVSRARKHIAEIECEIDAFLKRKPANYSIEVGSDGHFSITMNVTGTPAEIGVILGDILHNLRSALDYAACELVRSKCHSDKGVYFPFCEHKDGIDEMIRKKNFHRAGVDAIEVLKGLMPYKGGDYMLRGIHDLDIRDKHQMLILVPLTSFSPVIRMWDDDGTYNPTVMPDSVEEPKLYFPEDSAFSQHEVVPTLQKLAHLVDEIILKFAVLANTPC